jgi:CRP-like cAMP-binding protein
MLEKVFKKDEFIFEAGDTNFTLYKIVSGKVLSFLVQGSKITPVGETNAGSFAGSNSFFLKKPTGTYTVALEETKVAIYTQEDLDAAFPNWLKTIAKSISQKTEENTLQIVEHGIKKTTGTSLKPLSIDEQRHYLQLLKLV